jgi:hypothetical protein
MLRLALKLAHCRLAIVILLAAVLSFQGSQGSEVDHPPGMASGLNAGATNSFPSLAEIFQGRTFASEFERDVFFLRSVRDRYPQYWNLLLAANITPGDYLQASSKLLRFVEELGEAMRDTNDPAASTNLALITSGESFYANTNAYHPEILRAAAEALIRIGPRGRKALASSFTEAHYRIDPESLEELARVIGKARPADTNLANALTATAFDFSTTNGGSYPGCTKVAVENLLRLDEGDATVRGRLKMESALDDAGRFQAIVDAITEARAATLTTNLIAIEGPVRTRLAGLTNSPSPYRNDLRELDERIKKAVDTLQGPNRAL